MAHPFFAPADKKTSRVPRYQKVAKIVGFRDFCLSLSPCGERFGEGEVPSLKDKRGAGELVKSFLYEGESRVVGKNKSVSLLREKNTLLFCKLICRIEKKCLTLHRQFETGV